MTSAEDLSNMLRSLLADARYEQENLSAPVRIQATEPTGGSTFTVAFSDGARFRVTVAQEGETP